MGTICLVHTTSGNREVTYPARMDPPLMALAGRRMPPMINAPTWGVVPEPASPDQIGRWRAARGLRRDGPSPSTSTVRLLREPNGELPFRAVNGESA
jgi:hypothetical protein